MVRCKGKTLLVIILAIVISAYGRAYGVVTPGDYSPVVAYNSLNNSYLILYFKHEGDTQSSVRGQLVNPCGIPYGQEFIVSSTASYSPSIAFDSVNQRYMVVWNDIRSNYWDIWGHLLNPDGTLNGKEFAISTRFSSQESPFIAYDSATQRFLVTWNDDRNSGGTDWDIYGQLVNSDGTLYGTDFAISNAQNTQTHASVAYDSIYKRFLVAWMDYRGDSGWNIYGQFVNSDGSLNGTNFAISDAPSQQYSPGNIPSLAYDSMNQKFLVAWQDIRSGTSYDVYGQLMNWDGTLVGTNFVISNAPNSQLYPSIAFDNANQRFLVVWQDDRSDIRWDIYGQLVNPDGNLDGGNFIISDAPYNKGNPSVAYNPKCENFLVAFQTSETSTYGIGFAVAGTPSLCVDPYSDEYVIMVGSGKDESNGKLFYIPINSDGTLGDVSELADLGYRSGAGIADFDNDGDLDFVAGAIVERGPPRLFADFYLFENIGNGNFVKRLIAPHVDAGEYVNDVLSDNRVCNFAVANFDRDGFKDFVVPIYKSDYVYFFKNDGNTFTYSLLPLLSNPLEAKEGDFNEDGHMDFVITDYFNAGVYFYEGDGNGDFTKYFLFKFPIDVSDRAADITVGDFNEDGHLDIIVDDFLPAGGGHLYIGNGDGSFDVTNPVKVYSRPLLGKYATYGVDSFDFNKDGHMDLILSSYDEIPVSGFVLIMKGNGNGTFQGAEEIDMEPLGSVFPVTPSGPKSVMQATIDIDPKTLNLQSIGEFVTCYIGLPDGHQVDSVDVPTVKISLINATVVNIPVGSHPTGIDDYDQDGIAELMVKFGRKELISLLEVGEAELTVSGKLLDGTQFKGTDAIKVIDKGK